MGRVASGHVNREREFLRRAKLGDQPFKRLPQVRHSSFAGITLTVSASAGTQLQEFRPPPNYILAAYMASGT